MKKYKIQKRVNSNWKFTKDDGLEIFNLPPENMQADIQKWVLFYINNTFLNFSLICKWSQLRNYFSPPIFPICVIFQYIAFVLHAEQALQHCLNEAKISYIVFSSLIMKLWHADILFTICIHRCYYWSQCIHNCMWKTKSLNNIYGVLDILLYKKSKRMKTAWHCSPNTEMCRKTWTIQNTLINGRLSNTG